MALADVVEWLKLTPKLTSPSVMVPKKCRTTPPLGFFKCNYDAAFNIHIQQGTSGWIVRDYQGNCRYWGSALLGTTTSSLEAEGKVLLMAIQNTWSFCRDPAPGDYVLRFDSQNFPVLSTWKSEVPLYRSGPWNGKRFIGAPGLFQLTWGEGNIPSLSIIPESNSYTRVQLDEIGLVRLYSWNQRRREWDETWVSVLDTCDMFGQCRPNAYCAHNRQSMCNCMKGFEWRDNNSTPECVRKTPINCGGGEFLKLGNMNIPEPSTARLYPAITGVEDCREMCLRDCTCTAFAISNSLQNDLPSCITWIGNLVDIRSYSDEGQDLYVRLRGKKKKKIGLIIGFSVGIPALALFSLAIFCCWKRKQKRARARERESERERARPIEMTPMERAVPGGDAVEDQLVDPMDFGAILKATDNFSQEIGEGGFGTVYKGRLASGQEIAVKKLSGSSKQGTDEFYAEVKSIASLRHVNIVRLYGWSVYKEEKLLIYEYLENGSLERHLFGGGELNWQTRFHIVKGVAQGLAYIEEGCHDMIVHRDLKPENILLGRDMTPKISDFGLARMCGRSEKEAFTERASGTHGYMPPEYMVTGIYSAQSDIFSFGVTLLEIVSGKKNRKFSSYMGPTINLVGFAWIKHSQGNWEEIVDEKMMQEDSHQMLRCVEIALLCVQENPRDRPKMTFVVAALEDESIEIQKAKRPGFFIEDDRSSIPSSSHYGESSSTPTTHRLTDPITQVR